ncbi:MAG: hypothetical protein KME15_13555 [Drouetiella hepatica Uher 2000/2452]|jgi:hypothetical protein|uniref:Uncharacterized protein n=1 Tax=Drouetiella hepatica Uher 2000/2452 TaxID=904376 RepID=A0A951QAG1_9CYAN|nr:hypothetical protein [Drouetiella hepatica Uher 2000/2452]
MNDFEPVSKKDDSNYEAVRGHIPKKMARHFKGLCAQLGIDHGAAMEEALEPWMRQKERELEESEIPQEGNDA